MDSKYRDDTMLLYLGGEIGESKHNPEVMPIYNSTAYIVKDADDYDFAAKGGKYYYSRTANPNRDGLAEAVSFMENGEETIICSSGMGAIATTLFSLLKQGDHILFSKAIYGETLELANNMLKEFGIEISYADFTNLEEVKRLLRPNTKILYTEIIANPLTFVVDIDSIVKIAHENGSLVVVDSTFTTPFAIKPLDHDVDIVLHSLTKYFGGHSDVTGGSVTSSKSLMKIIRPKYLLLGCCMDPNTAWLAQRSIQTMAMRVNAQFKNAEKLAKALSENPAVKEVHYPGLLSHPQHELAKNLLKGAYGAMISFRVEDDLSKVNKFMHRLQFVKYLGTLGGIRTTIAHPAAAFRNEFSKTELEEMGMFEGLIRISTGAENIEDLISDFSQALEVFQKS